MRAFAESCVMLFAAALVLPTTVVAGDTAIATAHVEIVEALSIDHVRSIGADRIALELTGTEELTYDIVLPPAVTAIDDEGRSVSVGLAIAPAAAGKSAPASSWVLRDGHANVELEPIVVRAAGETDDAAGPGEHLIALDLGDDELPVVIAYQ